MSVVFAEQELFNACRVLFGSETQVTRGFLEYLQVSGIKSAYRKKALETHPDRRIKGRNGRGSCERGHDLFHAVQQAYENLIGYLEARDKGYCFKDTAKQFSATHTRNRTARPTSTGPSHGRHLSSFAHRKARRNDAGSSKVGQNQNGRATEAKQKDRVQTNSRDDGRSGPGNLKNGRRSIPARKLLFGHYLYYSGIANWQTIVKALVWQRTKRPRLGEIGLQLGWLSNKDILTILQNKKVSDSFGQTAMKMGMLTANQLRLIVLQQKREQKKFGEYFTHKKIVTPAQLNSLIRQFKSHNVSASPQRNANRNSR